MECWAGDVKLISLAALMWAKAVFFGLLGDIGWKLGLFTPWGDGFSYDRSITSQKFEWTVRQQAKWLGLSWRETEGHSWTGIRLMLGFWRETRAARRDFNKLRATIRRQYGLNVKTPEVMHKFLAFLAEQSGEGVQK